MVVDKVINRNLIMSSNTSEGSFGQRLYARVMYDCSYRLNMAETFE